MKINKVKHVLKLCSVRIFIKKNFNSSAIINLYKIICKRVLLLLCNMYNVYLFIYSFIIFRLIKIKCKKAGKIIKLALISESQKYKLELQLYLS